jgi:hypothetical protein
VLSGIIHHNAVYSRWKKFLWKESLIAKTIFENNKNIIKIALIQRESHYFNFILTNETNHQEQYHIFVYKNIAKKEDKYNETLEKQHPYYSSNISEKNENSMIFKNNVVKLVNINTNEAKNLY